MRGIRSLIVEAGGASLVALTLAAPASAQIIHVDADATGAADGTSWADAFPSLVDGLAAASLQSEGEVWIAEGTYTPDGGSGDRSLSFLVPSGARLYGGFRGDETLRESRDAERYPSVLSGDLLGDDGTPGGSMADNSHHVVVIDVPTGIQSFILGLTIRGGRALGAPEPDGGGMLVRAGSTNLIGVRFEGNVARNGGAMFLAVDGAPVIEESSFLANSALRDGGAIAVADLALATVVGSRFHGNRAGGRGGAIATEGEGSFATLNSIFTGNVALSGAGGALAASDGFPVVNGCTLAENSAAGGADALSFDGALMQLKGSILWGPEGGDALLSVPGPGGLLLADTNVVKGWASLPYPLGSTFDADPQFVDVDGPDDRLGTEDDDVRLLATSPLIDAGPQPAGTSLDVNGRSRLLDGLLDGNNRTDVGAHEATNLLIGAPSRVSPGDVLTIDVRAAPGLEVVLMASPATAFLIDVSLGALLVDLPSLLLFEDIGDATSVSFPLPPDLLPDVVYFQAIGELPGSSIGNSSNLIEVTID